MDSQEEDENTIAKVLDFLKQSEYGTDDYNLAYKTLIKLEKKRVDIFWDGARKDFNDKQELLYLDIIDALIDVSNENDEFCEKPEIVAKIIKADNLLIEYCKAQIGAENNYPNKIKYQIKFKISLLEEAIKLC